MHHESYVAFKGKEISSFIVKSTTVKKKKSFKMELGGHMGRKTRDLLCYITTVDHANV